MSITGSGVGAVNVGGGTTSGCVSRGLWKIVSCPSRPRTVPAPVDNSRGADAWNF